MEVAQEYNQADSRTHSDFIKELSFHSIGLVGSAISGCTSYFLFSLVGKICTIGAINIHESHVKERDLSCFAKHLQNGDFVEAEFLYKKHSTNINFLCSGNYGQVLTDIWTAGAHQILRLAELRGFIESNQIEFHFGRSYRNVSCEEDARLIIGAIDGIYRKVLKRDELASLLSDLLTTSSGQMALELIQSMPADELKSLYCKTKGYKF